MATKVDLNDLRLEYTKSSLFEDNVDQNPIKQFENWMQQAIEAKSESLNTMTLATVTKNGEADARIVLLKSFSHQGFIFVTSYKSPKGEQLEVNPSACLVFWWPELERQVRINGKVSKMTNAENDELFAQRPRGTQIATHASAQSSVVSSRCALDKLIEKATKNFAGKDVPRPADWGGFCLVPSKIEFWQGGENRVHDRIAYLKNNTANSWKISRLSP